MSAGGAPAPYPPFALASRVCALERAADHPAVYERRGAEARAALLALLGDEWSFPGKRVLDFGCGAGRTLRHFLAEAGEAEIWGADIDVPSIEWISQNLCPPLHAARCGAEPPLPFADGSFDLIWALSVFTHLVDPMRWLAELHRVLAPGGQLIASYMGRHNGEAFTHEPWDEDRTGLVVLRRDQGWEHGGPMVLMSDWWVDTHWGRAFEPLRREPVHGQTWALLRRREIEVSVAQLAAPADDPRELAGLEHALALVEADGARVLGELRGHYESSLSWRITRPLRLAARSLRRRRKSPDS
jgi:SAM-dependent methyltransferase